MGDERRRHGSQVTLGIDQPVASDTSTLGTKRNENVRRLEDEEEQLLPGLLNDITLSLVVPKLPWTAFRKLASVSRSWKQAIKSRQIYDARVRSHSTETLVATVVRHLLPCFVEQVALYSTRDNGCYLLPDFPGSHSEVPGLPRFCRCILLDGKVYVLGGEKKMCCASSEVYVFDLVGQRGWEKCANMTEERSNFGCTVKDGKIYVFGGNRCGKPICTSELYDPEKNIWSRIAPMTFRRCSHQVATLEDELIVYRGVFSDGKQNDNEDMSSEYVQQASFLEVYHPVKDEWRVVQPGGTQFDEWRLVQPVGTQSQNLVFTAGGKLHSLTDVGIQVYDYGENTWSHRHSSSFAALGPVDEVYLRGTLAFMNELLLAVVVWPSHDAEYPTSYLLQSTGFESDVDEIVWQKANFPLSFGGNGASVYPLLGLIQL